MNWKNKNLIKVVVQWKDRVYQGAITVGDAAPFVLILGIIIVSYGLAKCAEPFGYLRKGL